MRGAETHEDERGKEKSASNRVSHTSSRLSCF